MLHFFKQKPLLRDLIPENHVDIHSHLLPGIDDGAKSIDDSINLAKQMSAIGFKTIITTPHIIENIWDNSEASIYKKHKDTADDITKNSNLQHFKAAAEYMIDANFLKRLESEKLLTLKDNYVLVELSYLYPPLQLYDIIFELQLAGYKPILAHPERYIYYYNNFKEFKKLKNSGCLFQLNLLAAVDYYGTNVTKIADKILNDGLYDFVGSDIHHQNHVDAFSKKVTLKNMASLEEAISKNLIFRE